MQVPYQFQDERVGAGVFGRALTNPAHPASRMGGCFIWRKKRGAIMPTSKTLWIVSFPNAQIPDAKALLDRASYVGANAVAIRSDSIHFSDTIPILHQSGIKVYAWRWPRISQAQAMQEAGRALQLIDIGLDGYIVDAEGQSSTPGIDWNQSGLESIALEFCNAIADKLAGKPGSIFGVTSHFRAASIFPKLPWTEFFSRANLFLPQSYWRVETNAGPEPVLNGNPAENYNIGLKEWKDAGSNPKQTVPMAGEIAVSSGEAIAAYGTAAAASGVNDLHFYSADGNVSLSVWNAIRGL